MQDETIKNVGQYCRHFRIKHLKLSLKTFSEIRGLNNKNVNAFEYGRANNIKYLFHYYKMATDETKKIFTEDLFKIL